MFSKSASHKCCQQCSEQICLLAGLHPAYAQHTMIAAQCLWGIMTACSRMLAAYTSAEPCVSTDSVHMSHGSCYCIGTRILQCFTVQRILHKPVIPLVSSIHFLCYDLIICFMPGYLPLCLLLYVFQMPSQPASIIFDWRFSGWAPSLASHPLCTT
jgi:hypothetical protein